MPKSQPRKLEDFGELSPAEQQVLDELDTGDFTVIGDDLPGEDAGPERTIRATFLRWVILGCEGSQKHRVHEKGVRIKGAFISGARHDVAMQGRLDLQGTEVAQDVLLVDCRFAHAPLLVYAQMQRLILNRSTLPGLIADGLKTRGDVGLRGIRSEGEVRLAAARIGGTLDCDGADLKSQTGCTLAADGLETRSAVFVRRATSKGEIRLLNAKLGSDLDCDHATFKNVDGVALHADGLSTSGNLFLRGAKITGEIRLLGVDVEGNLECDGAVFRNPGGPALHGAGMNIKGIFYWRKEASIEGELNLTAALIGAVHDEPTCWPKPGGLELDRCAYGAFIGGGISGVARKRWLSLQDQPDRTMEFRPQPYEQCARVLREMGHSEDARIILVEKERRLRAARRKRIGGWLALGMAVRDWCLGQLVGFGYKPLRAAWYLAMLWLIGTITFSYLYQADAFKPNSSSVLAAQSWGGCHQQAPAYSYVGHPGERQLSCFLRQPSARSYPAFNAAIYTLDVIAPVVQLEQHKHWTPDEDQLIGALGKAFVYFQIVAGWLLSLLAVAGLSGLIKSD
jgi:hypothetical protein